MEILLQLILRGLLIGGLYALLCVGFSLIFGVMQIPQFAYGDIIMVAMFTSYWFQVLNRASFMSSLLIILPIFFGVGLLFQKIFIEPILDKPELSKMIFFFGLSMTIQGLAQIAWSADTRFMKSGFDKIFIPISSANISLTSLLNFVIALIVFACFYIWLKKTYAGKSIRATAQERDLAMLNGINVKRVYLLSFGIGTAISCLGGVLFSPLYCITPFIGFDLTIKSFIIVALGGLGSIPGALIGGLMIGLAENLSAYYISAESKEVTIFVVFLLILLVRPNGMFGRGNK
jgi:branched-chain amino acid transport system permease protein